jgi:hypothetical protein
MEVKQLKRYDDELLSIIIHRDTAILLGEYNKLNVYSLINFTCKCGINAIKKFRYLCDKGGAFCKECAKVNGKHKAEETNLKKFGAKNPFGSKLIQEKIRKDMKEKHGVEYSSQRKDVIEKVKETNKAKDESEKQEIIEKRINTYNKKSEEEKEKIKKKRLESNSLKSEEEKATTINKRLTTNSLKSEEYKQNITNKIKNTCILKYGVDNPFKNTDIKNKIKETNIEKYGTEYATQSLTKEEWNKRMEKRKLTNLERFGYENPAQHPETFEKIQETAKRFKEYTMPSGEIRKIQGYEGFAINELLQTYTEDQIKTNRKDVGRIQYTFDSKQKFYNPDIGIPHENKLIEVKSEYTYTIEPEKIKCKGEACKNLGYTYEIWIYNGKGEKRTVIF